MKALTTGGCAAPAAHRWARAAAAALLALGSLHATAQDAPVQLSGTLQKVRDAGAVAIGYRESSVPFSYLSPRGEPIGYSIDLCKQVVDALGDALGRQLRINWVPVTAESRIAAVVTGRVDLECGSTTNNLERQQQVAFSPTMFVSGTKLMVKKGSPIQSFRDLAGRKVVVTSGTTNEKAMHGIADKFKIAMTIVAAPDHAASFAQLQAGAVDAFATDDVLLYGLLAEKKAQADFAVIGDFLSYEPYGVMFRKGDAPLAQIVNDSFHSLAEDGEIGRRYTKWFLRQLPSGVSLNLPMSPQLESLIQAMGAPSE